MASNMLLCRYANGWHERGDVTSIAAHGRREALLTIGAVSVVDEVERVADEQLGIFADVRDQFTAQIETRSLGNMPYFGIVIGDTAEVPDQDLVPTDVRYLGVTVTEDDEGWPVFVPQFNDLIAQQDELVAQTIKSLSNGTVGGNSVVASPVSSGPQTSATLPPP